MKLKFAVVLSLFFLLGCTVNERPEFIKVDGLKIKHSTSKEVFIHADAHFLNKNSIGGKLQINDVYVYVDSLEVATINSSTFYVPKKENFTIPLEVGIPYDKVFKDAKKSILGNVLNMISKKEIQVNYKGKITYKLGSFSYNYPLDYTEKVSIKL